MKDYSYNIIIRRCLLTLGLAAAGGAAWAVEVRTADELKTALEGTDDTITLTNNVTLSETLTIGRSVTLDLQGHDVSATGRRAFLVTAGDVVITSSTTTANITVGGAIAENSSVIRVGNNGTASTTTVSLTIGEHVSIHTDQCYGITVFGNATTETLVVNGTVQTTGVPAISGNGNPGNEGTTITIGATATVTTNDDVAIYHPQNGTLNVDGTVTGAGGIEMKGGALVVANTAKIKATGVPSHTANNNGTSTKGYAIAIVENGAYAGVRTVNISQEAAIEGPVAVVKDSEKKPETPDPSFEGGGLQMKVKVTDSSSNVVGQYLYLEDAVREAPDAGSTIALTGDCSLSRVLETTKSFTLDLDSHNITATDQGVLWVKSGTVSITSDAAASISIPSCTSHNLAALRVGSDDSAEVSLTVGQHVALSAPECYGIIIGGKNTSSALTVDGSINTQIRPAIAGLYAPDYTDAAIAIGPTAAITTTDEVAICHPQGGAVTIAGRATVTGAGGIELKGGTLTIAAGATIAATGTAVHSANDAGTSSRGYSIAIVETNAGAGVTAVNIADGATVKGPMAVLQDAVRVGFAPNYNGTDIATALVATIGADRYFMLKDAVDIVPADGTVTLLGDQTLSTTFVMAPEKTYTLDLAGHDLTGTGCAALQIAGGHVTLTNSGTAAERAAGSIAPRTITVSGAPTPAAAIILGSDKGSPRSVSLNINQPITVDGGSVASGILVKGTETRETLTVGGQVQATGHSAIATADACEQIHITSQGVVTATDAVVIYQPYNGLLAVDGTVTGSGTTASTTAGAIEMKGGDLTVSSGARISAQGTATHTPADAAPSTNGYAIAIVERDGLPGVGKVNIHKDATITGVIASLVDSRNSHVAVPQFTGDITLVAETNNSQSFGERYTTLSDAVTAAATKGEVRLLDDLTLSNTFAIGKAITLNMNDFTVTGGQSSGATLTIGADVVLKDGALESTHDGLSVTAGTVTLQDVTVTTTGTSLAVSGGTVTDNTATTFTSSGHNTLALSGGTTTLNGKVYNTSSVGTPHHAIAATSAAVLDVAPTATISSAHGNGIDWGSTGALTIAGGKMMGAEAVHATDGTVTIKGGSFTGAGHAVEIAGGTPLVSHGTFICGSGDAYHPIAATTAQHFVSGDYFSKPIAQTLCADGYMVAANAKSNGLYYLTDELVIRDGTAWTNPSASYVIGTARYVRNSGMGAGGTRFGTLCLPFSFAHDAVSGMTFYSVNHIADNTLYLDAITTGSITAGTPVVFQCAEATTGFEIESSNATISAAAATTANQLVGTFAKVELTTSSTPTVSSVYYLNGDAFHQASQSLTVPAFRAYITSSSSSSSHRRMLYIHTDDAVLTDIDALCHDDDNAAIYDLEGRRQSGLRAGMNVVKTSDGRTLKVFVK